VAADSAKAKDREARKRRLLEAVRDYVKREGAVPGIQRFAKEVGEGRHTFQGVLWPSWGAFLLDAGLDPGQMTQAVPEDELLAHLAKLTRSLGRFPSFAQLRFASAEAKIPSDKTYRTRFGGLAEIHERLQVWVADRAEYADVAGILAAEVPARRRTDAPPSPVVATPAPLLSDSLIPPAVDCIPSLAASEEDIERECAERGLTPSVELETRLALAFRILGLDVEGLGQGSGRVADGIARCRSGRWALVYDAKVRRGGFVMGTEDRKFREYIERHGKDLERDGVDSVYFAVISSSFDEDDIPKAREVVRLTKAKAFALVEAAAVLALVELKLRTRLLDDGEALERLLSRSSIIDLAAVQALEADAARLGRQRT
jgi:hypothetical protein